jgi:hypothetical protein
MVEGKEGVYLCWRKARWLYEKRVEKSLKRRWRRDRWRWVEKERDRDEREKKTRHPGKE